MLGVWSRECYREITAQTSESKRGVAPFSTISNYWVYTDRLRRQLTLRHFSPELQVRVTPLQPRGASRSLMSIALVRPSGNR